MHDYPQAYVIPVGDGQRSDAEANRLVEWALFNDIEVTRARARLPRSAPRTFEEGSYVILDGAVAARPGRHGAERRRRHLGAHPAAVRAAGGLEPRVPVGRRHGDDPRRREVLAADRPHPPRQPPQGLGAAVATRRRTRSRSTRRPRCGRSTRSSARRERRGLEAFSDGRRHRAVRRRQRDPPGAARMRRASPASTFGKLATARAGGRADRARAAVRGVHPSRPPERGAARRPAAVDQSTWVLRELGFDADPVTTADPELVADRPARRRTT